MTYKVYIRKDYKPVASRSRLPMMIIPPKLVAILVLILGISVAFIMKVKPRTGVDGIQQEEAVAFTSLQDILSSEPDNNVQKIEPEMQSLSVQETDSFDSRTAESNLIPEHEPVFSEEVAIDDVIPDKWESLKIESGDNLSLIFDKMKISPQVLHEIMSLGKEVNILKRLMPDHEIRFQMQDGELEALEYDVNLTDTIHISKNGGSYTAEKIKIELETRINSATGIINDSLFLTAQRAGLPDNLTMQMVELYGWDIDFALDIRKGDRFYVVYEEKYKDGIRVQTGPILSAEFINRNKTFRAVRYIHADGYTSYYNDNGLSMRKAFLRTPVKFSRISSRFSLARKHPVLNTIRAHRGVDYAAPTGTPIKATGDGVVTFAGNKGGYGRVVILRHGEKYSTLYGHMSKFARNVRTGNRVEQGQIIGYVGMSGLATGPHLHYEFLVNGIHRNPLTVDLPKAVSIPENEMADFKTQSQPLFTLLEELINNNQSKPVIALINDTAESDQSDQLDN